MKNYNELSKNEEDRAQSIHEKSFIINGLNSPLNRDLSGAIKFHTVLKEGGVTAVNITIGSRGTVLEPLTAIADCFRAFNIIGHDKYFSAESVEDIKRAKNKMQPH